MTGAMIAGAVAVAVLLAVGVVLGRQSSRQKKAATESLEAEREAMAHPTILDLVNEEVDELGLRDIDGAHEHAPDVLLRAWKAAPEALRSRDRGELQFIGDGGGDDVRVVNRTGTETPADSSDASSAAEPEGDDDHSPPTHDSGDDHA